MHNPRNHIIAKNIKRHRARDRYADRARFKKKDPAHHALRVINPSHAETGRVKIVTPTHRAYCIIPFAHTPRRVIIADRAQPIANHAEKFIVGRVCGLIFTTRARIINVAANDLPTIVIVKAGLHYAVAAATRAHNLRRGASSRDNLNHIARAPAQDVRSVVARKYNFANDVESRDPSAIYGRRE
ncbi:MAG: hypothetical protein M0R66_05410 [Candidatus Omnitrophica bacterium]|nr:hypothetical protein [Candidatus Omnitrophota bacterium]